MVSNINIMYHVFINIEYQYKYTPGPGLGYSLFKKYKFIYENKNIDVKKYILI